MQNDADEQYQNKISDNESWDRRLTLQFVSLGTVTRRWSTYKLTGPLCATS